MSDIRITRAHKRSKDQVRQLAEGIAAQLADEYQVQYEWVGDAIQFKRSGVSGTIAINDQDIDVTAKLGMLVKPFKAKIASGIEEFLDTRLA